MAAAPRSSAVETRIEEMDRLIKAGQVGAARKLLFSENLKRLPRAQAAALADIARRVNVPRYMLLILAPIVKPEKSGLAPATPRELALYATALSRIGVYAEAADRLAQLEANDPDVLLFQAYNFMFQWDFAAAIPKLRSYVARENVAPYARLVGLVNLASCQSSDMRWRDCEATLKEIWDAIKAAPEPAKFGLLYSNSLEIAAQMAILKGRYTEARDYISEASSRLLGSQSRYEYLIKKWTRILDVFLDPSPAHRQAVAHLKAEGFKADNQEYVRDLEFFEALACRDDGLFLRAYFGSPYPSFRKRIKAVYGYNQPLPATYDWGIAGGRVFDLLKGCESGGRNPLSETPLLLNLLKILARDFYRPVPLGVIISELYPGEYFNPASSPLKAQRAIARLRQWFKAADVPLAIRARRGALHLEFEKPYILRVPLKAGMVSKEEARLEVLRNRFGTAPFTAAQAAELLGVSVSVVQPLLAWGKRHKRLVQSAAGRSARYRMRPA